MENISNSIPLVLFLTRLLVMKIFSDLHPTEIPTSLLIITFLEKPLNKILLKRAISKALIKSAEDRDKRQLNETEQQQLKCRERCERLTEREREVLREIVAGKMNKVIAIDLGISVKTVELHRSRVMSKMEAQTPADLVKMYLTMSVDVI